MSEAELVTVNDEVHACRLGPGGGASCEFKGREMDPVDPDFHYVARDGARSASPLADTNVGAISTRSVRFAHHDVSATQPISKPHMMIAPRTPLDCGAPDS